MSEDLFDSNASLQDNIASLSDGNPGGATALTATVSVDPAQAVLVMEDLDKMNIHGSRIWIGYKDYCEGDAEEFIDCVLNQDEEMVEMINEVRGDSGEPATLIR